MKGIKETAAKVLFTAAAGVSILAVALICVFLYASGIPAIGEIGPIEFLTGTVWRPASDTYGIFPMILGSIYATAGALVIGVPVGLLCAVYLSRFASPRVKRILTPGVELLAGIPSVIYGFFGLVVLVPLIRRTFTVQGMSLLAASIILGIMILPTIITVARNALAAVPDSYYEGALALGADHERSVFRVLVPAAGSGIMAGVVLGSLGRFVAAVLSGVVCFSGGNMSDFPWVLTALTTAGAGLGPPLSGALPMYYLSRRLSRSGCAAAGYAGAKAVSRPRRLVLTDDDLFPAGTVTLNGYKVFGEERSRAVSYAASVARAAGSSLTPLLERQLTAEGGFHLSVEWVNYCEEGGVEANIRGETVLMGSAYFMKKRKVALPRDMKLSTGVFLAVDGALTAVFAVKYQPSRNAEWALRTLKRFHIVPVLAVRSGNVTPGLIKRKFGVDAKPVYPDVSTRLALAQLAEQQGEQPCVAICREGLMPLVESVAGSRRAVKAVRTATILSYIGTAAGVALAYYLTSVGNFALLTPIAMVLYQVLWLLPTLLLAGLVKHY